MNFVRIRSWQLSGRTCVSAIVLGAAAIIHPTMIGSFAVATAIVSFLTLAAGTLALPLRPGRQKLINFAVVALSLAVLTACDYGGIANSVNL